MTLTLAKRTYAVFVQLRPENKQRVRLTRRVILHVIVIGGVLDVSAYLLTKAALPGARIHFAHWVIGSLEASAIGLFAGLVFSGRLSSGSIRRIVRKMQESRGSKVR